MCFMPYPSLLSTYKQSQHHIERSWKVEEIFQHWLTLMTKTKQSHVKHTQGKVVLQELCPLVAKN